jgi:predicted CopG family antitoxin
MHRTTITLPDELFQKAKKKAAKEKSTVSEVLRKLLAHWVTSKARLEENEKTRQSTAERALSTYGMWSDRDPDQFLRESRVQLTSRDQELKDARLDS